MESNKLVENTIDKILLMLEQLEPELISSKSNWNTLMKARKAVFKVKYDYMWRKYKQRIKE